MGRKSWYNLLDILISDLIIILLELVKRLGIVLLIIFIVIHRDTETIKAFVDILNVKIYNNNSLVWTGDIKLVNTFGDVAENDNLAYFNSELNFSIAINIGNFSERYRVYSSAEWSIEVAKRWLVNIFSF